MKPVNASIKTLKINGRDVSGRGSESILQVARENGITIPTLCNLEGLTPIGACRLCMVEIAGSQKLHAACVTQVREGMVVHTETERLKNYRRMVIELLFSEREHNCAVCVSNGHCELQMHAENLGISSIRYPRIEQKLHVDATHNRFIQDDNRCILCARCVRVCGEIESAHTWDIMGRGVGSRVITDLDQKWGASDSCTRCGKCVHVCPTGALIERGMSVAEMLKRRQFLPYLTIMREEDA